MKRIVAAIVGSVFVLSACGSPGSSSNPLAVIVLAAEKTQEAGSARVWMDMEMDGPAGVINTTGDGVFDMAGTQGHMTMEMDMPDAPAEMPELGTSEVVFDGTVMYMKMPSLTSQIPGSKPWVSFDLQQAGEKAGVDMGALMQAGGSDPTQSMEYLRGASGDVETVGEEEIRGIDTTHYRASISFDKIVEQAPADLRDRLEPTIEQLKEWVGSEEMPIEVWIDDQGRMVRQRQSIEYAAGPAAGSSMKATMEMYDFGTAVEVEIPPASQVTDFRELMQGAP